LPSNTVNTLYGCNVGGSSAYPTAIFSKNSFHYTDFGDKINFLCGASGFRAEKLTYAVLIGNKIPETGKETPYMKPKELYNKHSENIGLRFSEPIYKLYEALNADEIDEFIDIVIANSKFSNDASECTDYFLYLALYSYSCGEKLPQKIYDFLLKKQIYYYSELYCRADEKTAIRLIDALESDKKI